MLNKAKNLKILTCQTTVKLSNLNKFSNRIEPNSVELIRFCNGEPNFLIIFVFFCKKFGSV